MQGMGQLQELPQPMREQQAGSQTKGPGRLLGLGAASVAHGGVGWVGVLVWRLLPQGGLYYLGLVSWQHAHCLLLLLMSRPCFCFACPVKPTQ